MSDISRLLFRLPPDLHNRIRAQADREGKSVNAWLIYTATARLDNAEPAALDQRDQMEALAQAWQDHDARIQKLERLARQAGADL